MTDRTSAPTSTPTPSVTCDTFFETHGGIALYIVAVIFVVVGLGVLCEADYKHCLLVITEKLNVSEDVAGATFMAAGTSSAEFFLSLIALLEPGETDDTGAGTIVGSAIFNVCVTIGLSALFAPSDANSVAWMPVMRDVVYNVLAFCWVIGTFADGKITWWEGMIGVALYASYVFFMVYNRRILHWFDHRVVQRIRARMGLPVQLPDVTRGAFGDGTTTNEVSVSSGESSREEEMEATEMSVLGSSSPSPSSSSPPPITTMTISDNDNKTTNDFSLDGGNTTDLEMEPMSAPMMPGEHRFRVWRHMCGRPWYTLDEGVWYQPHGALQWIVAIVGFPFRFLFHYTIPNAENPTFPRITVWFTFLICLVYLGAFTLAMVLCCQKIGCLLGMDEAVTGATILALGSSLPDALTSIFVARAGKADMAVSNVLGSNVFDVLIALGVPWMLLALIRSAPVLVDASGAVIYTGILFGGLFCFLGCMIWRSWRLDKFVAASLFLAYAFFLVFTILHEVRIIRF